MKGMQLNSGNSRCEIKGNSGKQNVKKIHQFALWYVHSMFNISASLFTIDRD